MIAHPALRGFAGIPPICRAMFIALALLPAGCDRKEGETGKAQPSQPPAAQSGQAGAPVQTPPPAAKPLSDLESLVAPIALYPDPLLAELLVASTYPLEVVQAARWLDTQPDLSTLNAKDWDSSVQRLTSVPQVLKMMSDHLDWTTQLGDAFLAKPAELMDTIQALRKRAQDSGFLKNTPEQKVTAKQVSAAARETPVESEEPAEANVQVTPAVLKKEIITIEPAKADTVYVPQYNPETVYQAPMAPPPAAATTASYTYPAAAPAPAYYPTYYPPPATTTTTTSTTDSLLTFGAGALAGGLLTWGIMEWADDDDWDDHYHGYPVNHYYGGAVCNNGNCWHGGGGGYYGDRGNINRNTNINRDRDVNISGNEINIDRGGVFSQSNLRPAQQPAGWRPDTRHRRGQKYPEAVQQRLGRTEQPALAGQRLGAAQTLPAAVRGFGDAGARPATLPAQRRPSSAEVRQRLAQPPGTQERLGQARPSPREVQGQLGQARRDNALAGLRDSGQMARFDSRRGAESRQQPAGREFSAKRAEGSESRFQRAQIQQPRQAQLQERRAEPRQGFGGRERTQAMDFQRRAENTRPSAFEGSRNAGATQAFSQRGAASRNAAAAGGGRFGGAGASGGRRTGGGAAAGGRMGGGGRLGGGGRRR